MTISYDPQKLKATLEKAEHKLKDSSLVSPNTLYISSFIIHYVNKMMLTTMTPWAIYIRSSMTLLNFTIISLLLLKILIYDRDNSNFKALIFTAFAAIIFSIFLLSFSTVNPLAMCIYILLIIAADKVDFKKLCLAVFVTGMIIISFVTCMSQFGRITDLVVFAGANTPPRHSFGFIYPTDYAAHWLFLLLAYFYFREGNLKWFDYPVILLSALFLKHFCDTKTTFILILGILILAVLFRTKWFYKLFDKAKKILIASPVIFAVFSILSTLIFGSYLSSKGFYDENSIIHRLTTGMKMISRYGFHLQGNYLLEEGFGGSNAPVKDYTFIDNSYLKIALNYGLILFAVILLYLTFLMLRSIRKKDYALVSVIIVVLIACVLEHHLMDFSYNIFMFAGLTQLTDTSNFKPKSKKSSGG